MIDNGLASSDERPLIFFSYASPDIDRIIPIYDRLIANGFDAWLDKRKLRGGHNFDYEIKKALNKAQIIIIFISKNSVDRRGYVQKEMKFALDKAQEKLIGDIFIIPVIIDRDSLIPDEIKHIHYIYADSENFEREIEASILEQSGILKAEVLSKHSDSSILWHFYSIKERWEGLPGYEAELRLPRFSSAEHENISNIDDVIKCHALNNLMLIRGHKIEQDSNIYNFGQEKFRRTNQIDGTTHEPIIVYNIISIIYNIYGYSAGAAHGYTMLTSFNFMLNPILHIKNLHMIFDNFEEAFDRIKTLCRAELLSQDLDKDWVLSGTESINHFSVFSFRDDGILFHFGEYQVACYADGNRQAIVKYEDIWRLMKPIFISALGIERFKWQQSSLEN